ncbi:MAG: 23S rRNA (pseudouridine(1915)-N(3))-methyltransferase RlmH [Rhizobiales bacterium]|nr:23S rRNA (pseudouridine(1915)-N(3))-methyltransferase RlmH [Hyphomicrobiales bacterium]
MHLQLRVVGRLKRGPEQALAEHYRERANRIARGQGFSGPDVVELPEGRAAVVDARRADEAARLLPQRIEPTSIVALDEKGIELTSAGLASEFARRRDRGDREIQLLIGGADGLASELVAGADLVLSLGRLTLPHGLARIVLLEQIYRSLTILAGHPYHRE